MNLPCECSESSPFCHPNKLFRFPSPDSPVCWKKWKKDSWLICLLLFLACFQVHGLYTSLKCTWQKTPDKRYLQRPFEVTAARWRLMFMVCSLLNCSCCWVTVYTQLKKRCRVKSINRWRCDPMVLWEAWILASILVTCTL